MMIHKLSLQYGVCITFAVRKRISFADAMRIRNWNRY